MRAHFFGGSRCAVRLRGCCHRGRGSSRGIRRGDRRGTIQRPAAIDIRIAGGQALEPLVQPEVLVGHATHVRLDPLVEAQRVGYGVVAGHAFERRADPHAVTGGAGQALREIGQHHGTGHPRDARGPDVGRGRHAEERHHLGALAAVGLVGRVPDDAAALEHADHVADAVARDQAGSRSAAAPLHELLDQRVLRGLVHHPQGPRIRHEAGLHLEHREVRNQQDHATPLGLRAIDVLQALDLRQRQQPLAGGPPGQRGLADRDADAAEVLAQDPFALGLGELGQAQREIAARDAPLRQRQAERERAERAAHLQQAGIRQAGERPQQADREPGRPVLRRPERRGDRVADLVSHASRVLPPVEAPRAPSALWRGGRRRDRGRARQRHEPIRLAPQHRPEVLAVEELGQRRQVRPATGEVIALALERHVARDLGELAREERGLAMLEQLRRQLRGAADRQLRHLVEVVVDLLERGEGLHQRRRRLRADAGHALDVVDRIAGQREIVGIALRGDAEMRLDLAVAQADVVGVVPVDVAFADQLCHVLVTRDHRGAQALAAEARVQRADDVVGLVFAVGEVREPQVPAQLATALELQLEVGRCRLAVGLVGGIDAIAERAGQALVERHREILRPGTLDQVAEEARKAEKRVHRVAVAVRHVRRHGVIRPEDVDGSVDQVDHADIVGKKACARKNRSDLFFRRKNRSEK